MITPDLEFAASAHLVGIGGAAMTPLATILLQKGVRVSGSDVAPAPHLDVLRGLGAHVTIGHRAQNLGQPDVVVVSSAVPDDNAEIAAARARGIPVVKHSAALATLMRHRRPVAVAGTHGKSTTTALIAFLLDRAGLDPTIHVGAEVINYGLFGRFGRGEFLVAEADEFDRRFLDYDPEVAVITSVEPDHLDYFGDFANLVAAYQAFLDRVRPGGLTVACVDDKTAASLRVQGRRVTYGSSPEAEWQLLHWEPRGIDGGAFSLRTPEDERWTFQLCLLGEHNALNATAALAVASLLGAAPETLAEGLSSFRGARRRLERIGEAAGVTVIDDYAHHPTEVRASLRAIKAHQDREGRSLWLIYQPHTQHRTASLFESFTRCFEDADHAIITPAYMPAGRLLSEAGASAEQLMAAIDHPDARCLSPADAAAAVAREAESGDIVVVMGAGDIWMVGSPLLQMLEER